MAQSGMEASDIAMIVVKQQAIIEQLRAELASVTASMTARLAAVERDVSLVMGGRLIVVDPHGSGGAFRDVNDAIRACKAGDTVVLRPGTYTQPLLLDRDDICLRSSAAELVEFAVGDGAAAAALISATAVVENITFRSTSTFFPAVRITGGSPTLRGCRVIGGNLSCVQVDGGSPCLDRCHITGSKKFGVQWRAGVEMGTNNSKTGTIEHSVIEKCDSGLLCVEAGGCMRLISCELRDCDGFGARVTNEGSVAEVRDTRISDCGASAVEVDDGALADVSTAAIFNSRMCGVLVGAGGTAYIRDSRIFANELANVRADGAGAHLELRRCKVLSGMQEGIVVRGGATHLLEDNVVQGNLLAATVIAPPR